MSRARVIVWDSQGGRQYPQQAAVSPRLSVGTNIGAANVPPPSVITDTYTAAWASQGVLLLRGRARITASGSVSGINTV